MTHADRSRFLSWVAVAALVFIVACGNPPSPTGSRSMTSPSPITGPHLSRSRDVVLAATLGDNQDIYLEDPTSAQLTRLTTDPAPDGVPVWSASGTRLSFVRFAADGSSAIHLMNADGSDERRLTSRSVGIEILPSWSPNGSQIAFVEVTGKGGSAGAAQIFTINADGSALVQLTHDPAVQSNDPVWSPDGSLIAFDAGDPKPALYVMDPTGGHVRSLSPPDALLETNWPLIWSPDGSTVAFAGTGPDGKRDVYVVGRDGTRLQDLTANGGDEGPPAWSPDGRQLAFWSDRDGSGDIYVVAAEGGSPRRLTTGSHVSGTVTLAWSPDGLRLIVWNRPSGQGTDKNYLLAASGGALRPLISGPSDEFMAFWRPGA